MLGVTEFYRMGGAQAIAALAYGTESIPRVDKIVGPGNAFVTAAKKLVAFDCAIDMLAGPTEIVVTSEDGNPAWIAAGVVLEVLSCAGYVVLFGLVFGMLSRRLISRLSLSELAVNSIVSVSGLAGIALGAWVLRTKGISVARIAKRSVLLFVLTSAVNVGAVVVIGVPMWLGLIPGVSTIGWGHSGSQGFIIDSPLFRGANADVNLTFAMALVFFACWLIWALQENGPLGFLKELFAPKGDTSGVMRVVMIVVFFASGCLEIVSILFRPVSLSFRLYGNVFAGENMLETMSTLVPHLGWLLPIPFYFLELLVGLVQALVFMLLTAVFTLLICQHEEPAVAQG